MTEEEALSIGPGDRGALLVPSSEQRAGSVLHLSLDDLLARHDIRLDDRTKAFCEQGIELMRNSTDPSHNVAHLERMFATLNTFLLENKGLSIDFDTLLISISWHDVWRATNFRPTVFGALYPHFTEGRNAGRYTTQEMRKAGFNEALIEKVKYCVERHPGPEASLSKRETTESRILHDLDHLDSWSEERLQEIRDYLLSDSRGRLIMPLVKRAKRSILTAPNHTYYFESSQRERDRRFPGFERKVEELFGK